MYIFRCFHRLSGWVLKHSRVALFFSLSMSTLLFNTSLYIFHQYNLPNSTGIESSVQYLTVCFMSFILIPANSLWSDAMSGPRNVRHFITALFLLLFTIKKSIMFFCGLRGKPWGSGFKSRPGQTFGLRFLLQLRPLPIQLWWVHWLHTVSGKMRRWWRGLATRPHMPRLRKWSR